MTEKTFQHICSITSDTRKSTYEDLSPNAPWHTRFLRAVHKFTLAHPWIYGTKLYLRSNKSIEQERRRQLFVKYKHIIHPFSIASFAWQLIFFMVSSFNLLYFPTATFLFGDGEKEYLKNHSILESFAVIDIVLKFFTGYIDEETMEIVLDPKRIARKYLKTWFIFDAISTFPFTQIAGKQARGHIEKCFIFLKALRFPTFFLYMGNILRQFNILFASRSILKLALQSIYFFHWFACVHFQYARFVAHFRGHIHKDTWIVRNNLYRNLGLSAVEIYVFNLNEVMKFVVSLEYTERILLDETIFLIIAAFFGYIYFQYIVVLIFILNEYFQSALIDFISKLKYFIQGLKNKKISPSLRRKAIDFIGYKYGGVYFNERKIVNTLSHHLKREIKEYVCINMLRNANIFDGMPYDLQRWTISKMKREAYMDGDVILQDGCKTPSLFFIFTGTVSIATSASIEMKHLVDNDFFGESTIVYPNVPLNVSFIAMEITIIYRLYETDFQVCVTKYPELKKNIRKVAKLRKTERNIFKEQLGYLENEDTFV